MVLVALAIRLIVMGFLYPEQLDPVRDHWRFAYENGRLARSIVEGHGLASPLFEDTGPSAWMTPVYPYIIAGVFKAFGVYSKASAFVLLSFQALISALTCLPVYFFARILFGQRVALWSGWAWALFPYAIYFSVERIWGTWLSTLLISVLFLITLHLEDSRRLWHWIGFGLLWGFAALNEPVVMAAWPFMMAWSCYHMRRQYLRWRVPLLASVLALLVVVTPWFARNYATFGRFIPFRDTLGLELRVGNCGDTSHWHASWVGPWHNPAEWQDFKSLGEVRYMQREAQRGMACIRSNPRRFAALTLRRVGYVWTGFWSFDKSYLEQEPLDVPNVFFCTALTALAVIGLRRTWRKRRILTLFLAAMLLAFPSVYYITHVEVYVRRQIDPLIVVLAVYALVGKPDESYELVTEE